MTRSHQCDDGRRPYDRSVRQICGHGHLRVPQRDCKHSEEGGYLVKVWSMKHNVGSCYCCHTTVEPRVSKQWFVKMEPLAKPAIDIVRDVAL